MCFSRLEMFSVNAKTDRIRPMALELEWNTKSDYGSLPIDHSAPRTDASTTNKRAASLQMATDSAKTVQHPFNSLMRTRDKSSPVRRQIGATWAGSNGVAQASHRWVVL